MIKLLLLSSLLFSESAKPSYAFVDALVQCKDDEDLEDGRKLYEFVSYVFRYHTLCDKDDDVLGDADDIFREDMKALCSNYHIVQYTMYLKFNLNDANALWNSKIEASNAKIVDYYYQTSCEGEE